MMGGMTPRSVTILAVFAAIGVVEGGFVISDLRREAAYERELAAYSNSIKLGTNRDDVEDYLRARGLKFEPVCCTKKGNDYFPIDDVRLGRGKGRWFCEPETVYLQFEFTPADPFPRGSSGTLRGIGLSHSPGGLPLSGLLRDAGTRIPTIGIGLLLEVRTGHIGSRKIRGILHDGLHQQPLFAIRLVE